MERVVTRWQSTAAKWTNVTNTFWSCWNCTFLHSSANSNSCAPSVVLAGIDAARMQYNDACATFTVSYLKYRFLSFFFFFFLRKTKLWEWPWRQSKVMDTIRQRDVGVGEKISKCEGGRDQERERARGERGEMNNCLTGGMKKPLRVFGAGCWECVRCGVAQHSLWVIHHANTAGGHSLAQRYAEQGRIMCCACTRSIWLKRTAQGATFTHPPPAHFMNLPAACIFSRIMPQNRNRKQDTCVLHHGGTSVYRIVFQLVAIQSCCCRAPNMKANWHGVRIGRRAIKKALCCH